MVTLMDRFREGQASIVLAGARLIARGTVSTVERCASARRLIGLSICDQLTHSIVALTGGFLFIAFLTADAVVACRIFPGRGLLRDISPKFGKEIFSNGSPARDADLDREFLSRRDVD